MAKPQAVAPQGPRFVRHVKRPAWGVGRIVDVFQGRIRVRFSDGEMREFRDDVLEAVAESEATPELLALTDAPKPVPTKSAHAARARKALVAKAAAKSAATRATTAAADPHA